MLKVIDPASKVIVCKADLAQREKGRDLTMTRRGVVGAEWPEKYADGRARGAVRCRARLR